jgi:hypothetical protein
MNPDLRLHHGEFDFCVEIRPPFSNANATTLVVPIEQLVKKLHHTTEPLKKGARPFN